ncbi:elongation factor 1 alpha [Lineolata rhizophorae]|uniref:Elongation factor 1 alpha-like protein n=1 Tax=Lineolata rhizophorae TaxID=578093 RepID=A0A6A6NPJ7_9PEZI|nr:elongation factor 1 alpha [Lineolata rhizophorae]
MSGHRRVKDISYDEDDLDYDYDEGDEYYEDEAGDDTLSPEDQEQMRVGTIKVREALGPSITATEKEIQDALWNYYYDVANSVKHIRSIKLPKQTKPAEQPKPTKSESRFDQAAKAAANAASASKKPGPSPDDIVINAQKKGTQTGKHDAKKKASATDMAKGETNDGLEKLSVKEIGSKNLDVVAEFEKSGLKNAANFVVIGHVDHGKSTLMGRLLYDLNVVDKRSIDRLQREADTIGKSSFALAWVMDQTSEERNRGVTVDIAMNHFETSKTRFTILDAPGHQDFVPNMIAGASQADFAVLVIDAGTNSFESGLKGQTKEHALLVRSLGVQRLVVAVNKMDAANWLSERFEEIKQQMSAFLTNAGFHNKNVAFIPCSGLTGDNVARSVPQGTAPWYDGPTLVSALEAAEPAARALTAPLRITIADIFRGGIVHPLSISGRLEAGTLQVGDVVHAAPAGELARVSGLEVDDEAVDWAVAGQIATVHLSDIDGAQHLRLGDVLCSPQHPVPTVTKFTAKILSFEHVLPMQVSVLRGRVDAAGHVEALVATLDKSSGAVVKRKPKIVQPGAVARVRIRLDKGIPLEDGARVVLRVEGKTVAAGLVEVVDEVKKKATGGES